MSYYVIPHLFEDAALFRRMTHSFLIRHPAATIASYHRLDPDVTQQEIGLDAQWRHVQALSERGLKAHILRAEDIRQDPYRAIGDWWRAIDLPSADHAFDWQGAMPDDWQQVKGWHTDVLASTGIRPEDPAKIFDAFEVAVKQAPKLQGLLEYHLPFYQKLLAFSEDNS